MQWSLQVTLDPCYSHDETRHASLEVVDLLCVRQEVRRRRDSDNEANKLKN